MGFLKTVYDYDVISFAEKHYFATSATGRESGTEYEGESRGGRVIKSDERSRSVTVEGIQEERSGTWTKPSKRTRGRR